jgi:hypothetical protein
VTDNGSGREGWMIEVRSGGQVEQLRYTAGAILRFTTRRQADDYCRRMEGGLPVGAVAAVVPYRVEAEDE